MNKLIISFLLAIVFLSNTGSVYAKDDHKSHKDKKEHRHHDKHDDDDDRCEKTEFKSWDKLRSSKALTYVEDESRISVTSICKIKFHKDFNFSTTKDLSISAKKIEFKKTTSLSANRLLLVASKELKLKKHSQLCADVVILETAKLKNDGAICSSAQVLGSAVGQASAVAILEVISDSDVVPAQVSFDWSKSFGVFSGATVDLGDGRSLVSSSKSLSATYELAGSFNSSVTLQTPSGTVKSNVVALEFKEPNPIADFGVWHVIHRGGTPPEVWLSPNIYPLVEPGVQIKEYRWRFGEGTELVMPFNESPSGFVSFNYPAMGVYDVEVDVVTVNGFSKTASLTVDLNNPSVPVPKYKVSSFKGGSPLTVTFTGEAYDGPNETITYNWFFADTGEQFFGSQFQEVTHTFNSEGVHYVYLETRDDLRGRRITYIPIYVGDVPEYNGVAPVAITDSSARFGEGPLTVDFSGIRSFDPSGSEIPLSYHWDFGDYRSGELNQAFSANASHTFNHPGSYFVNLTVTNSLGLSHSEFMLVSVDGPEVNDIDFEVMPTGNSNEFAFSAHGYFLETDYSMDSARWSFGDSTYQTYEPYVVHQYASSGTYDVELKIRRLDGAFDSYTRRLVVNGSEQAPNIDIIKQGEWFNLGDTIQLAANFSAGAASDKTIYRWSLGDQTIIKGQGDNFKTIAHSYLEAEDKNIRLTVTAENGLTATVDTFMRHNKFAPEIDDIKVYGLEAPAPVKLGLAPGEHTIDLDGNLSHFVYEFGDGSANITTQDGFLSHSYTQPGTYLVAVTAVDITGLSTRFEKQIVVKENQAPIIAHVPVYGNLSEPAPVRLAFVPHEGAIDDQYIQRWRYNFGDGSPIIETTEGYLEHDYLFPGMFTAIITAYDPYGLSSSYSIPLEIKANQPPVLTDFDLHIPEEAAPIIASIDMVGYASDSDGSLELFEYDWGDGTVTQTNVGYFEHSYLQGGEYQVSVRVQDDKGTWSLPVKKSATVRSNIPPTATVALLTQNVYAPTTLKFSAFESKDIDGEIKTYIWALSDGRTFDGLEIEVDFSSVGEFVLNLQVVDNKGGIGTNAYAFEIKQNNAPNTIIVIAKNEISEYEVLEFDGSLSNDPNPGQKLNFEWTFSDGKVLRGEKVYHFFENEGTHQAELVVTDESGLSGTAVKSVVVTPLQVPPPSPIFNISGAIGPNGGYRGEISFDAKPSTVNSNDEIISYEWLFDDGKYFEGRYIARGFAEVGEHNATLTVKTALGLARSLTKTFVIEQTNDPHMAYSEKPLKLTSPDVLVFQPNNIRMQWTLEEGSFHPELETNVFVNDKMVERTALQFIASNILEANVVLEDGKNMVRILGFDDEEYQILKDQVIYSGSRSVTVTINDHNGNPVRGQSGTIFLTDNKEVKSEFLTDTNGVANLNNVPSVEAFVLASSPGFYAAGSLQAKTVNKVLTGIEINPELVNNENMDFSNGLVGWQAELPVYEITPTEEGSKLSASITDGQRMKLRRIAKFDQDGFTKFPIAITSNLASGFLSAIMTNTRTGETYNVSQVITAENERAIKEQLFVYGQINDVVVLDLEIVMSGDAVSLTGKLFDSFANTGSLSAEMTKLDMGSFNLVWDIVEESSKINEDTEKPELSPERLNYLSIIDFTQLKNGTDYDFSNYAYIDFNFQTAKKLATFKVKNFKVMQNNKIIAENSSGASYTPDLYDESCTTHVCTITPRDLFNAGAFQVKLNGLQAEGKVTFESVFEILYEDGSSELPITITKDFYSSSFLFAHDWTYNERHYDGNLAKGEVDDHFNLNKPTGTSTDKGDFWSNYTVFNLLNLLMPRDSSFVVGDVSNINGGHSTDHGTHKQGNGFDAQTQYFKGGKVDPQKFSKKSIDEIEHLLSTPGIGDLFYNVLAADKSNGDAFDDVHVNGLNNRCVQGRTLNNYIKFQEAHWHHWHFNGPRNGVGAGMPSETERVSFDLEGVEGGHIASLPIHPNYPDYNYIKFKDEGSIPGESGVAIARHSFRLRDVKNEVDLFETYEKNSSFENSFIRIIKVEDGVVYKIKTENLTDIVSYEDFPSYLLIGVAIAPGDKQLCDKKEVPVFNIVKDCNKDGVEDDPGYKTLLGGVIGLGINTPEGLLVQNDARVCGKNTTVTADTITIDNGAILDNVQLGNTCNSILIDGDIRISNGSKICALHVKENEKYGTLYISGSNILIDGSTLYGDVTVGSNANIDASTIAGNSVSMENAYIYKSTITGHSFISNNAYVMDSSVLASSRDDINSDYEGIFIDGGGVADKSHVSGIGLVNGNITNAQFSGNSSFVRSDGYIVLHLYPNASVFNGARALGNGWIAGFIQDGGVGEFHGTPYFHSGVAPVASIGSGGHARCYSYVSAGQLNKGICHQVYNGFRFPSTMDIDDWIAGKPWPVP